MTDIRHVRVREALAMLTDGALLLDVREDHEWDAGRSPDALHVALHDVPDRIDTFNRHRPIVCVCRSGARSARAGQYLVEQGFDAVNLEGGMLAWSSDGQPMVGAGADPRVT